MLAGIRSAKKSMTFETFVYEKGDVPKAFADALAERARAGVKVHVILDAHGAAKREPIFPTSATPAWSWSATTTSGIPICAATITAPIASCSWSMGKVGFIGGVGIADEWAGNADSPEHWRDSHFRIEGPAVAQLQGAFTITG